jgi:hypothetical protein
MAAPTYATTGTLFPAGGGVSLLASGLHSVTFSSGKPVVGRGLFAVQTVLNAVEVGTGNETYKFTLYANTRAATSTWYDLGTVQCFGCGSALTGHKGANSTETIPETFAFNPYDYQVYARCVVGGTVTNGINATMKIYPIINLP